MLTPRLRLFLAVLSFAFGCYRVIANDLIGFAFLGLTAILTYGYFKYGTVWLAFRAVAGGNVKRAAALLSQVQRPESLGGPERAYFELASGFVCAARSQNDEAEQHLRLALAGPLRTENDRALAEAVLAQLLVARNELPEARTVLEQASSRTCRPEVGERIRALRDELTPAD